MAARVLFRCAGGDLTLPDRGLLLVDRVDGGNLVVNPPRPVWERSELRPDELVQWSFLIASAGRAMIDTLPQLEGGCVNYWEAGNWALNELAEPRGPKRAPDHRRVHLHLLGRSRNAKSPAWRWGESPKFPDFADRQKETGFERLTAAECNAIVGEIDRRLREVYGVKADTIVSWAACRGCGYPAPAGERCAECPAG